MVFLDFIQHVSSISFNVFLNIVRINNFGPARRLQNRLDRGLRDVNATARLALRLVLGKFFLMLLWRTGVAQGWYVLWKWSGSQYWLEIGVHDPFLASRISQAWGLLVTIHSHPCHVWVGLSAGFAPADDIDWAQHRAVFDGGPSPAQIDNPALVMRILPIVWRSLRSGVVCIRWLCWLLGE